MHLSLVPQLPLQKHLTALTKEASWPPSIAHVRGVMHVMLPLEGLEVRKRVKEFRERQGRQDGPFFEQAKVVTPRPDMQLSLTEPLASCRFHWSCPLAPPILQIVCKLLARALPHHAVPFRVVQSRRVSA